MEFLLALQFLTRIPVSIRGNVEVKHLARSMAYFPLIGLILGLLAAGVYTLTINIVSSPVCDILVVAFMVIVTGNMHVDGLMDTADGIFSGRPREGMLEIMKDSRVGSHGVMAGLLIILFKIVLLGQLSAQIKVLSIILMPVLGRWAQVYAAAFYPYARVGGGTGSFTDLVGKREFLIATLTAVIPGILFFGVKSIILFVVVMAGSAGLGRYLSSRLGGLTGDTYGAMSECIEVLTLVSLHVMTRS